MNDMEQKKIFSNNLNYYLNLHNKTQKEVADSISVSPQTFNTWCQGIALPRMGKIQKLADYFHIGKFDLIDKKEHPLPIEEQQPKILEYYDQLNDLGKHEAEKRVSELTYISKYTTNSNLRAAHNDFADNDEEIEKIRRDFDKF